MLIRRTPAANSALRFRQVRFVNIEPNEVPYPAAFRRNRRISDTQEGIEHQFYALGSVQLDTPFRKLNWKCRRVGPFLRSPLNGFIRNEPGIPAAANVAALVMRPPRNVALVLIRHPQCPAKQFHLTG